MVQYRRNLINGGTYFFTVTLLNRQSKLLIEQIEALREAVKSIVQTQPFEIIAWVVLPDHIHTVWKLPNGDCNYSSRWRAIKSHFVRTLKKQGANIEMRQDGSAKLWQRRFWEHTIKDENDLRRCVDYCYINPVKHGLVKSVADWPYSSFHRDVKNGLYVSDWAGTTSANTTSAISTDEFGE